MKRTSVIALGAGLWLLGAVPGALASGATPPQPTDPKASSPAGTIYEIPLDAARSDAAPHRRASAPAGSTTGGGGGGTGAGGSGSSGGSSSGGSGSAGASGTSGSVGTSGGAGSSGSAGISGTSGSSASATDPGSYVHSENGFGSSSQVPGLGRSRSAAAASPSALGGGDGGSAPTGSIVLIGVVLLVGAYAGIFAGRRARA